MYRMTARSIALISPMRQSFAALSKASSFAADIIAKYSGTEPFPLSGEALVYFNALRERLEEEKKLRDNVNLTLRLVITRRLILEGKLSDPTVTKLFISSVSGDIERNLHFLRITDNNAYIRTTEALSYINNTEDLNEFMKLSEVYDGSKTYQLSSVNISALDRLFFGENSEGYAYSGAYGYKEPPTFVYKKETAYNEGSSDFTADKSLQGLSDNAEKAVISETVINADSYRYDAGELVYKMESSEISENTDVRNLSENVVSAPVTNVVGEKTEISSGNFAKTDVRNVTENAVSVPVTNVVSENTDISSENFAKTDVRNVTENAVSVPVTNVVSEKTEISSENFAQDIRNVTENEVFAPVNNIVDEKTEVSSETVVNVSESSYRYDAGELTYKTERTEISENTDIQNITENAVSAPVADRKTDIISGTVINDGDRNYKYEGRTVKEEEPVHDGMPDLKTPESAETRISDEVPTLAEAVANIGSDDLKKVSELTEIGLLVMNSFLSGGSGYISDVKEKYIHKHIALSPVVLPVYTSAAAALLNSPRSSFGVISYAVDLLASDKELTPYERSIYDSAVTKVYFEHRGHIGFDTKQMFAGMDAPERTKVLSLVVRELEKAHPVPVKVHRETAEKAPEAKAADVSEPAERTTIRSVFKKLVSNFKRYAVVDEHDDSSREKISETTVFVPSIESFKASETELRLLKLLNGDRNGDILRVITASDAGDTISSQLVRLYSSELGGSNTERTVVNNLEKAVYSPAVLNYVGRERYDLESIYNTSMGRNFQTNTQNSRILNEIYSDTNNFSAYRTDLRNINSIQTQLKTDISQSSSDTVINRDTYDTNVSLVTQDIRNVSDVHGDTVSEIFPRRDILRASTPVFRKGLYSGEIVKAVLDRIERYKSSVNTVTERKGVKYSQSSTAVPVLQSARTVRNDNESAQEDSGRISNYAVNTVVNEYALPVTVMADSTATENIRLLPVYTLDRLIMPKKPREISSVSRNKPIGKAESEKRSVVLTKDRMTILKNVHKLTKNESNFIQEASLITGRTGEEGFDSMLPDEAVLRYREPDARTRPEPAAPVSQAEPNVNELIRQFGNLIEGADAGLMPSFDIGSRGIGDAMATIEKTAEKVEINSKLIEEIREKQRRIESDTLKASDMDAISDEMIRRLRSRMRLDRSRFSGQ